MLRAELAGEFNTGSIRHRLTVGADYDRFESNLFITRFRGSFVGSDPNTDINSLAPDVLASLLPLNVFDPVFGQGLDALSLASDNTDTEETLIGYGVYIQDQIDITDNFQIRIGGRFDDFEQDFDNLLVDPAERLTDEDTRFSPQIGFVHLINDGISLFASYGEGYRQQTGRSFENEQFEPNITESLEFGAKFDLGALSDVVDGSVNVAVFQVDQSNILVNDDRPFVTGFFSIDAGAAESRGIELDANVEFSNDWSLWLSYAHTDAEFTTTNPDPDGFGNIIEAGDPLINAPENQLNIQLNKGFQAFNLDAKVGAGVLYVSDRNGFVGTDFTLPSYTTARLFAEVRTSDKFSIRLDVENLFDETFYTNSFADVWVEPGAPRNYRLSASYSF